MATTIYTKKLLYTLLTISAFEWLIVFSFVRLDSTEIFLMCLAWGVLFAWNLVKVFNVENRSAIFRMIIHPGDSIHRKVAFILISIFGFVMIPGAALLATLTR